MQVRGVRIRPFEASNLGTPATRPGGVRVMEPKHNEEQCRNRGAPPVSTEEQPQPNKNESRKMSPPNSMSGAICTDL